MLKIYFEDCWTKSKYLEKILSYEASINKYVGPKYGNEKLDFISSLDLFVHRQ